VETNSLLLPTSNGILQKKRKKVTGKDTTTSVTVRTLKSQCFDSIFELFQSLFWMKIFTRNQQLKSKKHFK